MRQAGGILVAVFGLLLGGCNAVMTEAPMFETADTVGAPALKPGVWTNCSPAELKNPRSKCAPRIVVTAQTMAADATKEAGSKVADEPMPYVLAAGDPQIMQLRMEVTTTTESSSDSSEDPSSNTEAPAAEPPPRKPAFVYLAVKPTSLDSEGRIVALEAWTVQCGPPISPQELKKRPKSSEPMDLPPSTLKPFPGMTLGLLGCTPDDKAALRAAGQPSRAFVQSDNPLFSLLTFRWIGDPPK